MSLTCFLIFSLLVGQSAVLCSQLHAHPATVLSLHPAPQPVKSSAVHSQSGKNETGSFLMRKLSLFSKFKRKNREQPSGDLSTSDSSPIVRFTPYAIPTPIAIRPYQPVPLASPSMRVMSYYPNPYFASADPFGAAARRMAMAPRHAYMPSMPAYFPLGSMTGTPLMDPGFQAALASSLVNRYSAPLPLIGGPSFLPSSFYDDTIDQASLANILKRYFKSSKSKNKQSKYSSSMDDLYHKSDYDYGYAPRYDAAQSRIRYPVSRPSRTRADSGLKGYDYTMDRSLEDAMRSESQFPSEDGRFDSRTGIDAAFPTPSLPRYRDSLRDATPEPYVDIYGWRGPSRPISDTSISDSELRSRNDSAFRYSGDASSFGSRSTSSASSSSPASSYDKDKDHRSIGDGEKAHSL